MKITNKIWILLLMLGTSVLFFSCEKEEKAPEQKQANTMPNIQGADGVFWAIKAKSEVNTGVGGIGGIGDVSFEIGTAVAFLSSGNGSFVDMGEVKVDDKALKKVENNSYAFVPSLTEPRGITFGNYPKWTIEGKNGFAAVEHQVSKRFPTASGFTASATLDKTKNYTISFTNVSYADSILLNVHTLTKVVPASQRVITFKANELNSLPNGQTVINAAVFNYKIISLGGKKLVFGSQNNFSKPITIN